MKKIFTYLIIFIAIGTMITVVSLSLIDNFLYSMSQSSTFIAPEEGKSDKDTIMASNKIQIDETATNLQYSFNNKYFTYLKDKKVYIDKVKDGENFAVIEEESPICYYNLLYDKNLIIYITEEETSTTNTRLTIHTYDIETKRKSTYNKFNVTNFSQVKEMNMSPIINIIYINIETKAGTKTNNTIYRVDLFNSMSVVKSGTIFDRMIMLQHRDRVYYEDTKNNIYSGSVLLKLFKQDVTMIGIDYDDNMYFLTTDNKIVYKVNNNKIIDTIELSDTDVVTTYTNNVGTYIIYPTYVINVSAKDPYRRISRMSEYVRFEAIKGDTMYLRTSDNSLVTTKILVEEITEEEEQEE